MTNAWGILNHVELGNGITFVREKIHRQCLPVFCHFFLYVIAREHTDCLRYSVVPFWHSCRSSAGSQRPSVALYYISLQTYLRAPTIGIGKIVRWMDFSFLGLFPGQGSVWGWSRDCPLSLPSGFSKAFTWGHEQVLPALSRASWQSSCRLPVVALKRHFLIRNLIWMWYFKDEVASHSGVNWPCLYCHLIGLLDVEPLRA